MNVFQKIVAWFQSHLIASIVGIIETSTKSINQKLDVLVDVYGQARRPKVYVTLRGQMRDPRRETEGTMIWHGWTQSIAVSDDSEGTVVFRPQSEMKLERVDVLGPGVITAVYVGNLQALHSPFEAPATVEVPYTAYIGNEVRVTIKGIP
jgi:hypothetical protein